MSASVILCAGTTLTGDPCSAKPKAGSVYCGLHDPDREQKKRRARGSFGSIRQRSSGRWQATYRHNGKVHPGPTMFPAKADAQAWLSTVHADIVRGKWVDPDSEIVEARRKAAGEATGAYAKRWISGRSDLRPTTRAKYEGLLRLHIDPTFGGVPLCDVTPSLVRNWWNALAAEHRSTADDSYRFLRAVFNTAVSDELLVKNPCQVRGAGTVKASERPTASVSEVQAAVDAVPDRWRLAFLLAAWCQLRRGELLGLQRGDIDLLHSRISVRRAVSQPSGQAPVVGPPKTSAGVRTLAVPPNAVPALEYHLDRYVAPGPEAWLFPGEAGRPVNPRTLDRVWEHARDQVGRPDLRLHDLRHSGLTWSAASGASVAELMRRGGHANASAALRYQHATEDRDRAIAEALADLVSPKPTSIQKANSR